MTTTTVIVGGVAGGMSTAARLRRRDEAMEIIVVEASGHVSFANCGLPYHVGGVIPERSSLLLQTPDALHERFNLDVRVNHRVTAIDREHQAVTIRNEIDGTESTQPPGGAHQGGHHHRRLQRLPRRGRGGDA